ncbi:MAG: hypothetical protein AAB353_00875, partial [Candidatus Hydrogenedentota bacterium]
MAPTLNLYGTAYKNAGRNSSALTTIQSLDSDGDGFSNLAEITALTFPGNIADFPNSAPILSSIANQLASEGATISFGVSATDADNDPLTFSATGLPAGAAFTDNGDGTAQFDWQTDFEDAGVYSGIGFEVTDGDLSDSQTITLTVQDLEAPPILELNDVDESWGPSHPVTSQGMVLWSQDIGNDGSPDDVVLFDGNQVSLVQAGSDITDSVFGLGSGAAPGEVIGAWRSGTDDAYVFVNDGGPLMLVSADSPFDGGGPMNPEGLAIADGYVFIILQAVDPGTNQLAKFPFLIDLDGGGITNLNPSGNNPDVRVARISTSQGQAAWSTEIVGQTDTTLHYYDGVSVSALDSGLIYGVRIRNGLITYEKSLAGVSQAFLIDTNAKGTGTQLSFDADGSNGVVESDGQHVAWIHVNA